MSACLFDDGQLETILTQNSSLDNTISSQACICLSFQMNTDIWYFFIMEIDPIYLQDISYIKP